VELHKTWNLPPALLDVAARHHDEKVPGSPEQGAVHAVRLVSALDYLKHEPGVHPRAAAEVLQTCRAAGFSPARLRGIVDAQKVAEEWVQRVFAEQPAAK
jgi:hypothetical protein